MRRGAPEGVPGGETKVPSRDERERGVGRLKRLRETESDLREGMIRKMRDEAAAVASSRWNEHAQHKWEREVQAIAFDLLPKRDAYDRAELLAAMDSVPAESKRALSAFAWCAAGLARLVRSKGLVTAEEVLQRVGPGEHVPEGSPKFRPQQLVVVRGDGGTRPSQWRRPYHTMVGFLCGMEGRVVRFEGHARNDEAVGFGAEGSSMPEYTIAFPLQDLLATPEAVEAAKGISLEVEVLECWLEAVDMVDRIQKAWPPPSKSPPPPCCHSRF